MTIVILIILATISINAVLGDDGLIRRAEIASEHQANAEAQDQGAMSELDKYLANTLEAVGGNNGNGGGTDGETLQIRYEIEDIDASGKAVKLSCFGIITAEHIEAKLEGLQGITITEVMRKEWEETAKSYEITYEELLLEIVAGGPLDEETRNQIQVEASNNEMTYKQGLEIILEGSGVIFSTTTLEDIEAKVEGLKGITITEVMKKEWKETAESNNITYKEQLLEVIFQEFTKVDMSEDFRNQMKELAASNLMTYGELLEKKLEEEYYITFSTLTLESSINDRNIGVVGEEFIATRNGTYTVKAVTKDGRENKIEIKVEGIVEEKFSEIKTTTETYTEGNLTAKIPAGFAVGISEGINTIAGGLVITDAVDENGYSIGNEYVWIPVGENEGDFKRESFTDTVLDTNYYTEPLDYDGATGYTNEETEYNTMKAQVLAYHGFYIARYEAGVNSKTFRIGGINAQEVLSKRGVAPYNYVKWGNAMDNIGTNGAVYLAKNIYTGKTQANSVTSTLCYGVQWDAMCRYIEDYDRTLPTKTNVDVTGRVGGDNSKNIYDLAGNCKEWTMEASNSLYRVRRGGNYYDSISVSNRDCERPSDLLRRQHFF